MPVSKEVMRIRVLPVLIFLPPTTLNAAELTGRVTNAAGQPVPNAHVYIYRALLAVAEGYEPMLSRSYVDPSKQRAISH